MNEPESQGIPLRVILTPLDSSRQIAELEDDEPLVMMLIGPKGWVTDFAAGLATLDQNWTADFEGTADSISASDS